VRTALLRLIHNRKFIGEDLSVRVVCVVGFLVLQAGAGEFVISAYQELARQLSVALMHEERRCGYFTKQKLRMWALQDDTSASPEGGEMEMNLYLGIIVVRFKRWFCVINLADQHLRVFALK